eukprot:3452190-Ditylum_brightwellii.AAC.1
MGQPGKQGRKVTIISAYWVCNNSLDQAGPTTCWKQQWRQLQKKGCGNPDPGKIFLQDFSAFIRSRIEQDKELIIGMDANDDDQGDNRIDYIFIMPALISVLCATSFLPFNIPFTSDHGAAYANFDEEILFMGKTNDPVGSAQRNLISGNPT